MTRSDPPAVVNVRKADREKFDRLREKGPFQGREWPEIFSLCVSIGSRESTKTPLENATYLTRTEYFRDVHRWIIYSAAIASEGSLEVLEDEQRVWKAAEEFAATGIEVLSRELEGQPASKFLQGLEEELRSEIEKAMRAEARENANLARTLSIRDLLKKGEDERLEFKSTARWSMKGKRVDKDLSTTVAKTLVGFANAWGGILVIGVSDDGQIVGLEPDYDSFSDRKNRDGFQQFLVNIVSELIDPTFWQSLNVAFHEIDGEDVCRIEVTASDSPVYLRDGPAEEFYARIASTTKKLTTREAMEYVRRHWGESGSPTLPGIKGPGG